MSWKSIDVKCSECKHVWNEIVKRNEEDLAVACPKCQADGFKTISAPMVLAASYPDGHYRMDGVGRAATLDKLENIALEAKENGDFGRQEDAAKEWVHKKDEK